MELGITTDILNRDRNLKKILHLTDAGRGRTDGLKGVRKWQEIVRVAPIYTAPAQMVGKPRGLRASGQFLQTPEVLTVKRLRRAEIHGDAMLNDPVLIKDLIEHLERASAIHHVVLRDDLEPIDHGLLRKDVVVMRDSKPDTDTVVGESVEAVGWHRELLVRDKEGGWRLERGHKPPT
jgi:hypothetical protein